MYNYNDLSDMEFEALATDIVSKMLNVNLFRFGKGRDGGIDLCDCVSSPKIVVQVKHYFKTPFSTLFSVLKKEFEKVKRINPTEYYIVCSGELTPENVKQIFMLFKNYMVSERNIITLIQIENFLRKEINRHILLKHYKLWLCSVDLITLIQNNDISIDSDVLYERIKRHKKLFVQTYYFDLANECLKKNKVLMLIGEPGVGKTITSEMLVLHFMSLGYGIRFTTEVENLAALKKSLSKDPNKKEIIYLDDCLGQCYFKMRETQVNELQSLISYIKYSQNKILLLNSRVTIYKEALNQNVEFYMQVTDNCIQVHIIDMSNIDLIDKAKILYNHLYFSSLSKKFKSEIRRNNLYNYITCHKNYSPRIIEFIVNENIVKKSGFESYSDFVKNSLDYPEIIWQNEYDVRIKNVDRIFVNTLYSLTDTFTPLKTLKGCFNYYISNKSEIDQTMDQWSFSLHRLSDSFLQIIVHKNKEKIGVINPSVNDFLRSRLFIGAPGYKELTKNIINVIQSYRLLENADEFLLNKIYNYEILDFVFNSSKQKTSFIIYMISKYKIKLKCYGQYVSDYVMNPFSCTIYGDVYLEKGYALSVLFEEELFTCYNLINLFKDIDSINWKKSLKMYFHELSFKEIIPIVNSLYATLYSLDIDETSFLRIVIPIIQETMEEYDEIEAENIVSDKIVSNIVEKNTDGETLDFEAAAYELEEELEIIFKNEFEKIMSSLPEVIYDRIDSSYLNFHILNVEEAIDNFLGIDEYYGYEKHEDNYNDKKRIIDDMFKNF